MITKADYKKQLKKIAKQYSVSIRFYNDDPSLFGAGYWIRFDPKTIYLNTHDEIDPQYYLKIFFHELGHRHCWINNKFPAYHKASLSKYNIGTAYLIALTAEKWVDNWGKQECLKHYPEYKWKNSYRSKKHKKFLYQMIRKEVLGAKNV